MTLLLILQISKYSTMIKEKPVRLLSLDVLRGITIAGMIMVNNPGSWSKIYTPLGHASWDGLTPTDLIFPFFMFIMGVSMFMSLQKSNFKFSSDFFKKLLKRSVIIFAIGLAIGWFSILCYGTFDIGKSELTIFERFKNSVFPYDRIRILGVMQRLSLSYFFSSLIVVLVNHKYLWRVVIGILTAYTLILFAGNGLVLSPDNIIAVVDKALFGEAHMYKEFLPDGSRIAFDPEGLLSTIPCISHVLIGFLMGKVLVNTKDLNEKVQQLLLYGTIMVFVALLLSYGVPINKKVWSSTFVLSTCGFASQFLAILIWIIDINKKSGWTGFFNSFGVNPLFMYVLGGFLSILFGSIRFRTEDGIISIKGFIYSNLQNLVGDDYMASLLFSLFFIALNAVFGYILYRKRIYIKI